jgi:hypothetical protein
MKKVNEMIFFLTLSLKYINKSNGPAFSLSLLSSFVKVDSLIFQCFILYKYHLKKCQEFFEILINDDQQSHFNGISNDG